MPRSKRAFAVLGIIAALALAVPMIWFATAVYGVYRKSEPTAGLFDTTQVGLAFLEDLRFDRRAMAYHSMSSSYRAQYTLEQFSDFLDESPLLSSHAFARQGEVFGAIATPDLPQRSGRIGYTLMPARLPADDDPDDAKKNDPKTNRRKLDLTLHFVEENGIWVVDRITFP